MPSAGNHQPSPPGTSVALARLGWEAEDPQLREVTPTAARGHNLVVVTPPSPAYASPALAGMLTRLGEGRRGLLLCHAGALDEWAGQAALVAGEAGLRVQVARGTARATRRLRDGEVDLLVATPETALALHERSALRPDELTAVFLAQPEQWSDAASLTAIMQDLAREAQRIVQTAAPERAAALVERYARRALTVGLPEGGHPAPPPAGPVRTVSVPWNRRAAALAELVELLDPASVVVWTADRGRHEEIARSMAAVEPRARVVTGDAPRAATVIAFDLPSADRLRQLLGAGEVVLLTPPGTEEYVERIAAPRRPLRLPGLIDAVTTEAGAQRAAIVRAIDQGGQERALLTLGPLFERYDPAAVAAALHQLWLAAGSVPSAVPDIPATAKIYVGVGKKDGATVNDLVAVLTKEVRLDRGKIGRVELRDAYTLVEVPAQQAEEVARGLTGTTIRRKRVTARVDRGPAKPSRGERKEGRSYR